MIFEVVVMWFTHLFVNIDTHKLHLKWMKLVQSLIFSGSECQIWGTKVLKVLSPYLAVLWTFIYILFDLCVSHFVLCHISFMKVGCILFKVLKTSNPSVLRCFRSKHFLFSKTSWRRLEDIFKKCLQDFFQTRVQDLFKTSSNTFCNYVLKTSWKTKKMLCWRRLLQEEFLLGYFHCALAWFIKRSFAIAIKTIVQNS